MEHLLVIVDLLLQAAVAAAEEKPLAVVVPVGLQTPLGPFHRLKDDVGALDLTLRQRWIHVLVVAHKHHHRHLETLYLLLDLLPLLCIFGLRLNDAESLTLLGRLLDQHQLLVVDKLLLPKVDVDNVTWVVKSMLQLQKHLFLPLDDSR